MLVFNNDIFPYICPRSQSLFTIHYFSLSLSTGRKSENLPFGALRQYENLEFA